MGYDVNFEGQFFGFLRVEEKMPDKEDQYNVWRCHCSHCGGEMMVNTKRLKRGTITNCGCIPKTTARKGAIAEDLTGRKFGDLTVQYRVENHQNGRTQWLCECVCKNQVVVMAHKLKAGKIKSCGCHRKNNPPNSLNLEGQHFGRLTALYPTGERDYKGSVLWHCRCACNRELNVSADSLIHGNYRSCGCLKKEITQNIGNTLHRLEDTCLEHLEKRKYRSDNTSGFRGLFRLASGCYRVSIGFKKQRYHLGVFDTMEEAIQVRLKAEESLHDGFVEAYYLWEERASADPLWAERNPFYYDVEKVGEDFIISTTPIYNKSPETNSVAHIPQIAGIKRVPERARIERSAYLTTN